MTRLVTSSCSKQAQNCGTFLHIYLADWYLGSIALAMIVALVNFSLDRTGDMRRALRFPFPAVLLLKAPTSNTALRSCSSTLSLHHHDNSLACRALTALSMQTVFSSQRWYSFH